MVSVTGLMAQAPTLTEPTKPVKVVKKPKRQDQIMLDIHSSQILRDNSQGVKNKWYAYGFTFQLMWDQPIKKSPVALAAGAESWASLVMGASIVAQPPGVARCRHQEQVTRVVSRQSPRWM